MVAATSNATCSANRRDTICTPLGRPFVTEVGWAATGRPWQRFNAAVTDWEQREYVNRFRGSL